MTNRWLIGLAAGSSADGVDAALLETEGVGLDLRVRPAHALHRPHPRDLREMILRAGSASPVEVRQLGLLHRLLGETFAAAARQVADQASFSLQQVQSIGCLTHTVWHETDGRFPCTLGLGMAAVVAERTGVTVVSDFRARDLSAGGQGGPLEAFVDRMFFADPHENRALLHLGGTATLVYLPVPGHGAAVLAFEAGPCGLFLDGLMRQLTSGREGRDPGGKHAVQGRCIDTLLERWLAHPYLERRPPKSLPRQAFGEEFAVQAVQLARQMQWSLHDLLCTATHFVARGITTALHRFVPQEPPLGRIILSGGGIRNGLLWHLLEQQLAGTPLAKTDQLGVPTEMRKALTAGVLAALTVDGVPANLPTATGAVGARLLGHLTPGSSANWARCLTWMAAQQGFENWRN